MRVHGPRQDKNLIDSQAIMTTKSPREKRSRPTKKVAGKGSVVLPAMLFNVCKLFSDPLCPDVLWNGNSVSSNTSSLVS